uniref:Chorismate mutase n=1 Tax=Angiostrongylus cantonensis TaxID=6313 RepID=A0A0K0D7Z6_ANGCA
MVNAAKVMRNPELEGKFEKARIVALNLQRQSNKRNGYVPGVGAWLGPFDVPLSDLEKNTDSVTTLNEQCSRFLNHYVC